MMRNWGTFPPRNNDKDYKSTQSILTDTLKVKYFTPKMRVLELVLENEHVSWVIMNVHVGREWAPDDIGHFENRR